MRKMINESVRAKAGDDALCQTIRQRMGHRSKKRPIPVQFVPGSNDIALATVAGKTTILAGIPRLISLGLA